MYKTCHIAHGIPVQDHKILHKTESGFPLKVYATQGFSTGDKLILTLGIAPGPGSWSQRLIILCDTSSRPLRLVLTAYPNFFLCFFVFVVCRFCTSKWSFGYVFLNLARCVFVNVFVRDWPKTKIWLESFRRPQISQNISCFGSSQNIYQNIAMLLGLSRLGNTSGVV